MENAYESFAYIYDELMYDVDYKKWATYLEMIFKKYKITPKLILDLGCGTGSMCIELSGRGYEMIGADISVDMLNCAKDKAIKEKQDILFIEQDMCEFDLYGSVDIVLSLMDSVNYITNKFDLKRMFKLVQYYLNPNGIFIFDINTEYKLSEILGNNVYYDIQDEFSYIWQNKYSRKERICEFELTFFVKKGEMYSKWEETHYERAYSINEIKKIIEYSGLKMLAVFDELKLTGPKEKSQRVFFVCQKID